MASFLIPLSILIPIALVVIILIVVAWIIFTKNKKLYQKITTERRRFTVYKKEFQEIKQSKSQSPEKDFAKLSKLARAFFREYLNLNYSSTYLELEKYFTKQNKQEHAKFCKLMSDINYAGKKTDKNQNKQLIELFDKIMQEH